jgi:hypothetical protein
VISFAGLGDQHHVEQVISLRGIRILARLRHHPFFSLPELNAAIRALLEELNTRPFTRFSSF